MKVRKLLLTLALLFLLGSAFYFYISSKYVAPILMYHRIDAGGETSLSVSPENFRRQMHFLSQRNYNVIALGEYVQAKNNNQKLPRNTVVITFDDGYDDNYTTAYPILKKYNLPATIFVIVDAIGRQGYLNHAQIKEMLGSNSIIEIGSHSLSGTYLPGRARSELSREIALSKRLLEREFDKEIKFFCYPIGGFTPEIQEMVKSHGYQAACTTNRGKQKSYLNEDLLALKRIKVKNSFANLFTFWAKVSGHYNLFRKVKDPH